MFRLEVTGGNDTQPQEALWVSLCYLSDWCVETLQSVLDWPLSFSRRLWVGHRSPNSDHIASLWLDNLEITVKLNSHFLNLLFIFILGSSYYFSFKGYARSRCHCTQCHISTQECEAGGWRVWSQARYPGQPEPQRRALVEKQTHRQRGYKQELKHRL